MKNTINIKNYQLNGKINLQRVPAIITIITQQ